jgi:hypothetical protein
MSECATVNAPTAERLTIDLKDTSTKTQAYSEIARLFGTEMRIEGDRPTSIPNNAIFQPTRADGRDPDEIPLDADHGEMTSQTDEETEEMCKHAREINPAAFVLTKDPPLESSTELSESQKKAKSKNEEAENETKTTPTDRTPKDKRKHVRETDPATLGLNRETSPKIPTEQSEPLTDTKCEKEDADDEGMTLPTDEETEEMCNHAREINTVAVESTRNPATEISVSAPRRYVDNVHALLRRILPETITTPRHNGLWPVR